MALANLTRALVATRKGLFILERRPAEWETVSTHFLGIPVSMALYDPRDGALYAALEHGHFGAKLHRSDDQGASWVEIGVPAFPKEKAEDEKAPALIKIWALEPGSAEQPGRLWAGGMPAGLFRSDDRGQTWQLSNSLWNEPDRAKWFGGGNDAPGMHSVLSDPNAPDKITIAVSCGGVWNSPDAAASWVVGGKGLIATYMPPERQEEPAIQDPHRVVACQAEPEVLWMQHHCGVFRSKDRGKNWVKLSPPVSEFGFAVAAHPKDPLTAWFVPAISDQQRMPKDGCISVTRTKDGGQTWQTLGRGLPQRGAYDLIYRHGLDVDSDGQQLLMGSTTGALWASENAGDSWKLVNAHLPPIYAVRFFE